MKSADIALFGVLLCGSSVAAVSQNAPQYTGRIEGSVIATERSAGLSGALVTLVPVAVAAEPYENGNGSGSGSNIRSRTTGTTGEYRFESLPPGKYKLRITRNGYLPAEIDIELAGGADLNLSARLELEPVRLEPLPQDTSEGTVPSRDHTSDVDRRCGREGVGYARVGAVTEAVVIDSIVEVVPVSIHELSNRLDR